MKTKRILSFVCVLALVLTMCSAFTFAAAPEAEEGVQTEMSTRALQTGTLNRAAILYSSPSTGGGLAYPDPIPRGSSVYIYSLVTSNGVQFYRVNWQSGTAHVGYILKSHVTLN